ncbi:co-chaperone HscB [Rosenbergiella australiborealis]|uniref:Co-chaperone protein HscB n=1 Tax=Rosenbergiella australiborealis TaxID=1544696 RepID=A0ABS5T709_9GAMM|nr:co-chaperone HscB [Rosenbergiella australiborealis]MBT0728140.1 co-chaperone HscB [Rosenbergiella australiborealis]
MNFFTLFDLPESFTLDISSLAERYQALQRRYHPDNFATQPEAERLQALHYAANINQGYQALRKPLPRAEYILSLHGFDINNEQHTMHDTEFLMAQLTLRETLEEIEQQKNNEALIGFLRDITQQHKQLMSVVEQQLAEQQWQQAADTVRKLRFFSKLADHAEALEEKWLDF